MAMLTSDVQLLPSESVTNVAGTNGGHPKYGNPVVLGTLHNVFPWATEEELDAGFTRYRKVFGQGTNVDNHGAFDVYAFLYPMAPGGDLFHLFPSSAFDDYQDEFVASLDENSGYGQGKTVLGITAGVSTVARVEIQDASKPGFYVQGVGDVVKCRISDGVNTEYFNCDAVIAYGDELELRREVGTFTFSYGTGAVVSAMMPVGYPLGQMLAIVDVGNFVKTTVSGTFAQASMTVNNAGTRTDTLNITIKAGGTGFTVEMDKYGSLPDGLLASDYTAQDGDGRVLFTIPAACWGGTWAEGETVVGPLVGCLADYWIRQIVEAGSEGYWEDGTSSRLKISSG